MSNWAQKKGKEIPGTKNEMETKNQGTVCTLNLGLPGGYLMISETRELRI